ncbi:endonuclease Q family protein [Patescibacteria group bacterium]|nr:endonuclease Q family protein [Patescibacteria group bacterium]MBU2036110.1 endonuclease Q family protein [Patescibacteria group bacterium]
MKIISDLHFHSRFSRAVSPQMNIPTISLWAQKKGIELVTTSDFTHPLWFRELQINLKETGEGIYSYKESDSNIKFLLTTEISCIYSKSGKGRRVHLLVFAPNLSVVEKFNKEMTLRGANLLSDGRPITGLTAKNILEIALSVSEDCLVIPAHAWTPHFSVFGANSGFDSLEECFEELTTNIKAVETGLSSDPAMNWRVQELKTRSLVSFSDAHSPAKMGREATIFDIPKITYQNIKKAISQEDKDCRIASTIEFYPEEGKYHFTGHRNCHIVFSPNEARKKGLICPVCGKRLTVGVMSRVEELARGDEAQTEIKKDSNSVLWIRNKDFDRPPYVMIVPLVEIISESFMKGVQSQAVQTMYERLISNFDNEFNILLKSDLEKIKETAGEKIAEGILKVRNGDIVIKPGYDGVFGKVRIWKEENLKKPIDEEITSQKMLF